MSDTTENIFNTSSSMLFETHEPVIFPDGTDASFDEIQLRSIRLRPQVSRHNELHGVFSLTFTVGSVVASDAAGEPHELLDIQSWQDNTIKRIETETWVLWDRVPELVDMFRQAQQAGYRVEILKKEDGTTMTYADVSDWFADNPRATTLPRKKDRNRSTTTWMSAESRRGHSMLPATFVAEIGDMQEGSTKSVYDGLDDLTLLIQQQVAKSKSEEGLTPEDKQAFQRLIGNVLGYHVDNDGNIWPNRLSLNAMTLNGEEYNFYFDRDRAEVDDLDAVFATAKQRIADRQQEEEEETSDADIDALFS